MADDNDAINNLGDRAQRLNGDVGVGVLMRVEEWLDEYDLLVDAVQGALHLPDWTQWHLPFQDEPALEASEAFIKNMNAPMGCVRKIRCVGATPLEVVQNALEIIFAPDLLQRLTLTILEKKYILLCGIMFEAIKISLRAMSEDFSHDRVYTLLKKGLKKLKRQLNQLAAAAANDQQLAAAAAAANDQQLAAAAAAANDHQHAGVNAEEVAVVQEAEN